MPCDGISLALGYGDLESERPNSLFRNLVKAILPRLRVGTIYKPMCPELSERVANVRQVYARRFRYASGRSRSVI